MANTFKLKRSSVSGRAPSTSDLALGELALNTHDGKLYCEINDGSASIVELSGINRGGQITRDISNTATGSFQVAAGTTAQRPGSAAAGMIRFNTTTSEFEGYNGSAWVSITAPTTIDDVA